MKCKVTVVRGTLLAVMLWALLAPLGGQSRYPTVSPGQEIRVNGVLIYHGGKEATMGLTADDLEQLIYGVDEIPDYTVVPNPDNGNHTVINLDAGSEKKPVKWLEEFHYPSNEQEHQTNPHH